MSERVVLEPAFILHRRPYRDTSWIVDLFTLHHGRIAAVARSARGPRSRYRGALELFVPMWVSWWGRRELKTLGHVECQGNSTALQGEALLCGFYLNELLMRLLQREDPYPPLFTTYQEALGQLMGNRGQTQAVLRCFEKKLLYELGYGLMLTQEVGIGTPIHAEHYYQYIPDNGFSRCEPRAVPHFFSGRSLIALQEEVFQDTQVLQEMKHLMRLVLTQHLGDRPLKSRELLK
ncbi:MAG: DNA repair protein RecO [Coxiella sp. RIFCSPHIGHO2_12_FULL_44_14]|nr:MAG: DNA repair protein RecO [Coxiella sp. RIFCSPHIGHO2_12_FULL_44_14]